MKALFCLLLLLISTNIFAQEVLFNPVFLDQCTGKVITNNYLEYSLKDSNATYSSKRTNNYLILPKKGTYWLYIKTDNFDELPLKLKLENGMNLDTFYSSRRVVFNHSCQRVCRDLFEKEPEKFIGKYNSQYKLCDKAIANKLMFDLYFNGQLRIIGSFNENGQPIDTLKKYYNTGTLAELTIYNSKAEPQLLLSYYGNGVLKSKLDFVKGEKWMNYPSGREKLNSKFKVSSYSEFGKGLDTLKKYYDNGKLRELIAYDSKNEPQLILSYHENGLIKTKIDIKKGIGLGFYPSGKGRISSDFTRRSSYAVFSIHIKAYYENGQIKSSGEYASERVVDFYKEEEHKELSLYGSTNFESYYENGQIKLLSMGKYSANGLKAYHKNGRIKIRQRPKLRRTYNADKQLVGRIRKIKRVYSDFELETFLITYTPYYNWKWTRFDSSGKKKWKMKYSPSCDDPNCAFPDNLLDAKLEEDSRYEILIFEAGKAYQKIKVGYEDLYLYERKNKKWLEIRKLPKENIYKLLEELEVS